MINWWNMHLSLASTESLLQFSLGVKRSLAGRKGQCAIKRDPAQSTHFSFAASLPQQIVALGFLAVHAGECVNWMLMNSQHTMEVHYVKKRRLSHAFTHTKMYKSGIMSLSAAAAAYTFDAQCTFRRFCAPRRPPWLSLHFALCGEINSRATEMLLLTKY